MDTTILRELIGAEKSIIYALWLDCFLLERAMEIATEHEHNNCSFMIAWQFTSYEDDTSRNGPFETSLRTLRGFKGLNGF